MFGRDIEKLNRELRAQGNGSARCRGCTEGCVTPCDAYFRDVPGVVHNRRWSGSWTCVSAIGFPGFDDSWVAPTRRTAFDWHLDQRAAFEMNVLSNRYGLNQFDLVMGMVPWLVACQKAGLISEINGQAMDWCSPRFWAVFLHATAYREGLGETLAEGGWAAARALRLGEDLARRQYPGWGHSTHWDGHWSPADFFPYWLVSALQWLSDTRDPFNSGHGYLRVAGTVKESLSAATDEERSLAIQRARALGESVYGHADALDPRGGYRAKAYPGYFHSIRPVIKDCVPVDDFQFPLIVSDDAPDGAPDGVRVIRDISGIGDIAGPSVEYHLFAAGTGVRWPEDEFQRAVERICTLERALQVRHWGRDRTTDEMVLPFFEQPEAGMNPLLGERYGLDRQRFKPVMDEYYELHGWDTQTARPTRQRLAELDLADVHDPMVDGAARAKGRRSAT